MGFASRLDSGRIKWHSQESDGLRMNRSFDNFSHGEKVAAGQIQAPSARRYRTVRGGLPARMQGGNFVLMIRSLSRQLKAFLHRKSLGLRSLILGIGVLLILSGCVPETPEFTDEGGAVVIGRSHAAVALSYASFEEDHEEPTPSDDCENCGGDGELGDGTIIIPCPVCVGAGNPVDERRRIQNISQALYDFGLRCDKQLTSLEKRLENIERRLQTVATKAAAQRMPSRISWLIEPPAKPVKPVLTFYTASWCKPCQAFKRDVLKSPEVVSIVEGNFHAVWVDVSNGGAPRNIRKLPAVTVSHGGIVKIYDMNSKTPKGITSWLNESRNRRK